MRRTLDESALSPSELPAKQLSKLSGPELADYSK
ncbi:MAG: hypothetical protein ACI9LU_000731, partial [Polaribacter sp.]